MLQKSFESHQNVEFWKKNKKVEEAVGTKLEKRAAAKVRLMTQQRVRGNLRKRGLETKFKDQQQRQRKGFKI